MSYLMEIKIHSGYVTFKKLNILMSNVVEKGRRVRPQAVCGRGGG